MGASRTIVTTTNSAATATDDADAATPGNRMTSVRRGTSVSMLTTPHIGITSNNNDNNNFNYYRSILAASPQRGQDHRVHNDDESCAACMYTGMAFCGGLSLYFFKGAYLDLPERGTPKFTSAVARQRSFLVLCGVTSGLAGVYRWYLG